MQADLSTPGGRLGWAIKRRPPEGRRRGIRLFADDMRERAEELDGLQGYTMPSIQSYLTDDVEPSVTFLREAAALCGVRAEWLAFGQGAPTEGEELARRAAEGAVPAGIDPDVVQGFDDGLGAPFESLGPGSRAALLRVFAVAVERPLQRSYSVKYGSRKKIIARVVAETVAAPLASIRVPLGQRSLTGPPDHEVESCIVAICLAVEHLYRALPTGGQRADTLSKHLDPEDTDE